MVQLQHDARARCTRGGERSPAEQRLEVVRMNDTRALPAHQRGDLPLGVPPAQQSARGAGAPAR